MASSISFTKINSSAVCERLLLPGPIFMDGNGISAWSDSVESRRAPVPKQRPSAPAGGPAKRVKSQAERAGFGFAGDMFPYLVEKLLIGITFVAADVYDKRAAVGDDIVLRSGICMVTLIFTGPKKGDSFGKR